jgi:hypothetical protein
MFWLAVAVGVAPAAAMGIRSERTVLARGQDGSRLVEVRSFGPEGGGALAYRFEGGKRRPRDPVEYVLSSDFSPGDGSQPQTISPTECQRRLEGILEQLVERRYAGAAVHQERCLGQRRDGLVTIRAASDHGAHRVSRGFLALGYLSGG